MTLSPQNPVNRIGEWLLKDPDRMVGVAAALIALWFIGFDLWERLP